MLKRKALLFGAVAAFLLQGCKTEPMVSREPIAKSVSDVCPVHHKSLKKVHGFYDNKTMYDLGHEYAVISKKFPYRLGVGYSFSHDEKHTEAVDLLFCDACEADSRKWSDWFYSLTPDEQESVISKANR